MDFAKIISEALKEISDRGIIVVEGWYDKTINDTHITFCKLSDRTNNVSDDIEEDIEHIFQVDIWSKKDEWKLKKEVKKLMLENDFGYISGENFYEEETEIYHLALRFNYLEEVI